MSKPACICCGARKAVMRIADTFKCGRCGTMFDNSPDEGGDYSDRNPAARIEREERQQDQRRQRLGGERRNG